MLELLNTYSLAEIWFILTGLIFLRYILFSGVPYLYFYVLRKKQFVLQKLQGSYPTTQQILLEIKYSIRTLVLYSLGIMLFLYWVKGGFTRNYNNIDEFGWTYAVFSVILMFIMHDAYYYWTHRLMHSRTLYARVHRLHHQFKNPSPWCSFAFHPYEAFFSMGIIPIITFLIPWHAGSLVCFVTGMMLYDTVIHLGMKIRTLESNYLQISPNDHDVHHRDVRYNYGLYFTFWDRLFGTYKKEIGTRR